MKKAGKTILPYVLVVNNDVRRTVWSNHPDEDEREVWLWSNLEIVSVTKDIGSFET